MNELDADVLESLLEATAEPLLVATLERPDWPVVYCNPAFDALAGESGSQSSSQLSSSGTPHPARGRPLADVVERLVGRDLAVEISETLRTSQATSIPIEWHKRDYLLVVQTVRSPGNARHCALFWRSNASLPATPAGTEMRQALMRARRRIRDLSRDDPVTGLANESAFRETLVHDWAVAAREQGTLALIAFRLEEFPAYLEVFGRHAADSCLRRVAQALKRHLRRASDLAARISREEEQYLVVLSHSTEESGVRDFAERISVAVRELGLHHPRSKAARFVTVSHEIALAAASAESANADQFLDALLERF